MTQCSVGGVLRQIRESHGHSIRKAAEVTGLDRNLLRRLENNCRVKQLDSALTRFAAAYGIDPKTLLASQSPSGAFQNHVAALHPSARAILTWAGLPHRLRVALEFFGSPAGGDIPLVEVARIAGYSLSDAERGINPPNENMTVCRRLADVLNWKVGVPASWFNWGVFQDEAGFDGVTELLQTCVTATQGAASTASSSLALAGINRLRLLVESTTVR